MDPSKFLLFDWDVRWGTFNFGAVDAVQPDLDLVLKDKKCGTMGDIVLGHWVVGLTGTITVEAREIDHGLYEQMIAWNAGATTTSIPLSPSDANGAPKDLYDFAALLTLHPHHLPTNTTNLDLNILK